MTNDERDHTVVIVLGGLGAIALTISLLISGSIYNNKVNVDRDKFYASHCKTVSKVSNTDFKTTSTYSCNN